MEAEKNMSKAKIVLLCFVIAVTSSVFSVASFVFGFGYAIDQFRIDPLSGKVDKFVRLKEPVVVEGNNAKIRLPKGTVLHYDYRYKDTDSRASLPIIANFDEFEDRIEYLAKPNDYFYGMSVDKPK